MQLFNSAFYLLITDVFVCGKFETALIRPPIILAFLKILFKFLINAILLIFQKQALTYFFLFFVRKAIKRMEESFIVFYQCLVNHHVLYLGRSRGTFEDEKDQGFQEVFLFTE